MKKIVLSIALLLLIGAGCDNGQQKLIQDQQAQIDALQAAVKEHAATTSTVKINTQSAQSSAIIKTNPSVSNNGEDSQIKIEKCKTEAKIETDNQTYIQTTEIDNALNRANCAGDKSCENTVFKFLNDLSDSRQASAYNQAYLNCLSK